MFKKDGEIKIYKDGKGVSPKVADENSERYTVDDLVKDSEEEVTEEATEEAD